MNSYFIGAHGTLNGEYFIPTKNQTLIFLTNPGDFSLVASRQLVYNKDMLNI